LHRHDLRDDEPRVPHLLLQDGGTHVVCRKQGAASTRHAGCARCAHRRIRCACQQRRWRRVLRSRTLLP
jgi:hypothetical protein